MSNETTMRALAERICGRAPTCTDEAKTKASMIAPLFVHLGWDTTDQSEFESEHTILERNGRKYGAVDYAIRVDGEPAVLIEAKQYGRNLDLDYSQLYDYAQRSVASIFVLANGSEIWVYGRLDDDTQMDEEPFRRVDFCDLVEGDAEFIELLGRERFSVAGVLRAGAEYRRERAAQARRAEQADQIRDAWAKLTTSPSDALVVLMLREAGIEFDADDVSGYRKVLIDEIEAISDEATEQAVVDVLASGEVMPHQDAALHVLREHGEAMRTREIFGEAVNRGLLAEDNRNYNSFIGAVSRLASQSGEIVRVGDGWRVATEEERAQ